jgi:hypothetical protein
VKVLLLLRLYSHGLQEFSCILEPDTAVLLARRFVGCMQPCVIDLFALVIVKPVKKFWCCGMRSTWVRPEKMDKVGILEPPPWAAFLSAVRCRPKGGYWSLKSIVSIESFSGGNRPKNFSVIFGTSSIDRVSIHQGTA